MSNLSSWADVDAKVPHRVFLGIWTDWSRGPIMGATLTLERAEGSLLIAFTAFFIGLVSSCFWSILRLAIHRLYSTPEPRSPFHHQRQALLRNSVTALSSVWSFLQLAWAWRRQYRRALPVIACAFVSISAFTVAGGFSSQLSSGIGNTVLLDGTSCGRLMTPWDVNSTAAMGIVYPYSVRAITNAANYAQQCYSPNSPGMFDCATFVKNHLPGTVDGQAPCPFRGGICRSNTSNLVLDSGHLDSHEHLGINSPAASRFSSRSVMRCAPLVTDGYKKNHSTPSGNVTRYYYGSSLGRGQEMVNFTWQAKDIESQYAPRDGNPFRGNAANNFILKVILSQVSDGAIYLPTANFMPIPQLLRPDGDLFLYFLSGNGIRFFGPARDPWYRGLVPGGYMIGLTEKNPNLRTYWAEEAASPMACLVQFQFCRGSGRCGPLASFNDAATGALPLFNDTSGSGKDAKESAARRFAWFAPILGQSLGTLHGLVASLKSNALISQHSLLQDVMGPIPDNQWQLDVTYWWTTMLASIQSSFISTASGPLDPELDAYTVRPQNQYAREMCNNQKILSSDYTSFSVFGLCLTYGIGILIILVSYALEPLLALLGRRQNDYHYLEWTANQTLQLQRAAYQGIQSGTWTGFHDAIPKAHGEEFLADLPTHYRDAQAEKTEQAGSVCLVQTNSIEGCEGALSQKAARIQQSSRERDGEISSLYGDSIHQSQRWTAGVEQPSPR